mgnify:CR=1 FL=1
MPSGYDLLFGTSLSTAKLTGVVGVLQSYALSLLGEKLKEDDIRILLDNSKLNNHFISSVNLYKALLNLKRMFSQ